MKLVPTRRTDYAIRALIFIENADVSPVKANAVGKAMGIPTGFLQQVLRELLGAGIVTSRPGPSGGFTLARPSEEITVLQIVEAMEGPLRTSECALRGGPCHWDDVCALHRVWSSARGALCETARRGHAGRGGGGRPGVGRGGDGRADRLAPPAARRLSRRAQARSGVYSTGMVSMACTRACST